MTASASPLGKLSPSDFERLVRPHLGATRTEVLQGPRSGTDAAIVRVGAGRVLAITTDPLSLIPALGPRVSARLACHLVASDLWTTGIPPAYAAVDYHLPPHLDDATLAEFLEASGAEWAKLEVAVVTGHTGRYSGLDSTIVGSATLIGIGDEGRTVGPSFVKPGDRVLVTKGCAIETTAVAAHAFPRRLARLLDEDGMARARARLADVTVVPDCKACLRVGVRDRGVSLLHDATEGGVLGALVEVARATGADLRVERARLPIDAESRAACAMFEIDPYSALSEGTLVVAARPDFANRILAALAEEGIGAAEVGEVVRGNGTLWLTEQDGAVHKMIEPPADPYWAAYARAVTEGWD